MSSWQTTRTTQYSITNSRNQIPKAPYCLPQRERERERCDEMWWDVVIVVMVTSDKANIARLHSFITLIESSPSPQPPRHPMSMPAIMAEIQETLSGLTFPTRHTGWIPCHVNEDESNMLKFCQILSAGHLVIQEMRLRRYEWCNGDLWWLLSDLGDVFDVFGRVADGCSLTWRPGRRSS